MTLALIDADILVYEAAHRSQHADEWAPGEFTESASLPEAMADFETCINSIGNAVGADRVLLTLTDDDRDKNFRRKVWPGYKMGREGVSKKRPLLFLALREWIRGRYEVQEKVGIEADDTLGILGTADDLAGFPPVEDRVICSIDKDLLTIPGRHYDWRKHDDGVFSVTTFEADYNFMYQTLMGDSTDGFPGLKGCGKVTATKILATADYLEDYWRFVVQAFVKKGLTADDALTQARCARILRAEDWDWDNDAPILWTPPKEDDS